MGHLHPTTVVIAIKSLQADRCVLVAIIQRSKSPNSATSLGAKSNQIKSE